MKLSTVLHLFLSPKIFNIYNELKLMLSLVKYVKLDKYVSAIVKVVLLVKIKFSYIACYCLESIKSKKNKR